MLLVVAGITGMVWWMGHAAADVPDILPVHLESPKLSAMTANVRLDMPKDGDNKWTNRRALVVKTFLKYQPDVIACQEVSPAQGAYLNKELAQWYAYVPRGG